MFSFTRIRKKKIGPEVLSIILVRFFCNKFKDVPKNIICISYKKVKSNHNHIKTLLNNIYDKEGGGTCKASKREVMKEKN